MYNIIIIYFSRAGIEPATTRVLLSIKTATIENSTTELSRAVLRSFLHYRRRLFF